jgi:hypothetical protein
MNPTVRIFFEYALTRNLAFVLFFGFLLPIISTHTLKQSYHCAIKYAVTLLFATLAASAANGLLVAVAAWAIPAAYFLITLLAIRLLLAWGELKGEWGGIPRTMLAWIPFLGTMFYLQSQNLDGLQAVNAAFGSAAGFFIVFIIVAALTEQIRLSEAPALYKRLSTLLFAIFVFALAFAGFTFY